MERNEDIILVIDDDRASRRMLARALNEAGYTCRESSGGIEALEMLRSEVPSLLLLDFHMPGLNGAEVLSRLRADENPAIAQLPAIMLTGDGGEESELLCLEAGANDFVTKPINLPVLRARIDTQLRLQSLRRQLQQQNDKLEAWREDLERDLAAARLTQQSLIPQKPPSLPGWDSGGELSTGHSGGRRYLWLAADVGSADAFLDGGCHRSRRGRGLAHDAGEAAFPSRHAEHTQPAEIMEAVNNDLRSIFGGRSFMTAMCVALDPDERPGERGRRRTSAAPRGATRRRGRNWCNRSAPPLGLLEHSQFASRRAIELRPGDGFLLYTDGLYGAPKKESRTLDAGALAG